MEEEDSDDDRNEETLSKIIILFTIDNEVQSGIALQQYILAYKFID